MVLSLVTIMGWNQAITLPWRHNGRAGVSNRQSHDCVLNRLFGCRSKKTSKLRVTGLCVGNSPTSGEFPAQMGSYAVNISIWWRHHGFFIPKPQACLLTDCSTPVVCAPIYENVYICETKILTSGLGKSLTLTLYMLKFSEVTKAYIYILCQYSKLIWHRQLESFLK